MKVRDFIERLQKLDQDKHILVLGPVWSNEIRIKDTPDIYYIDFGSVSANDPYNKEWFERYTQQNKT